jgi:hypothetical protein
MTSPRSDGKRACSAHRTDGVPCRGLAIRGGTVCNVHGGRAPQVKHAAEARILALVDPSLNRIEKTIADDDNPALALAAARDILDRAGLRPTDQQVAQVAQTMRVTIAFDHNDDDHANGTTTLSLPDAS